MFRFRLPSEFALLICVGVTSAQDCEHRWTTAGLDFGHTNALTAVELNGRRELFIGGYFFEIQGLAVSSAAVWDGNVWSDLRGGFQKPGGAGVNTFAGFDDGSGMAVFAGGQFSTAGSVDAMNIARWDGEAWSDVAGGISGVPPIYSPSVNCLYVWNDGRGSALYVGGYFDSAGDRSASGIARWDGESWSAVGGGVNGIVNSVRAWDDGTGDALYCGGWFTNAGGQSVSNLAKWDGKLWANVGGGVKGPDGVVIALETWDDGSGECIYVGGRFDKAGGQSGFNHIARWDGQAWDSMNGGFVSGGTVNDLFIFDNGNGPALYAGGEFVLYKHQKPSWGCSVVRWDGSGWVGQGKGPYSSVRTMASYPVDGVPTLWVGGAFSQVGEQKNLWGLAYHQGGSTEYPGDVWRDGVLDSQDFWIFMNNPFDRNDDGFIDLFDYLDFLNAFNEGCP